MRRWTWIVLMVGASAAVAPARGADGPADLETLAGTWSFASIKSEGRSVPAGNLESIRMVIEGESYRQTKAGQMMEDGKLRIDPSKSPAEIRLEIASGPQAGKVQLGIYRIDGPTLTLCLAPPGDVARPTEFVSRADSKALLFVLKRESP